MEVKIMQNQNFSDMASVAKVYAKPIQIRTVLFRFLIVGVMICFILTGCNTGNNESDEEGTDNAVPSTLQEIEGLAEDAYDTAIMADHSGLSENVNEIDKLWQSFRSQAVQDGTNTAVATSMDNAVDSLKQLVNSSADSIALARSANAISALMSNLYDIYNPIVPSEILSLDYLGREIVLDGMETDFDSANLHVAELESTWAQIEDQIFDNGGTKEAKDYNESISTIRSAIANHDGSSLISEANQNLEVIDLMEQLYDNMDVPD